MGKGGGEGEHKGLHSQIYQYLTILGFFGDRKPSFSAEEKPGTSKFGPSKDPEFEFQHLGLPAEVLAELEEMAKHSLAIKTWSSYKTAERSLMRYCKECKVKFDLPVSETVITGFVHWLVISKGVKSATVSGYLAGIRKLHIIKGLPAPVIRSELIQMVLKGRKNIEDAIRLRQGGNERQPVTPDILELIKIRLRAWEVAEIDKCLVWTVCTLLFHGAFRGGELLCKSSSQFDPAFDLLRRDIVLISDSNNSSLSSIQVKVKAPKERKDNRAEIVDVYQSDTKICPVRAFRKWHAATTSFQADQPAFRLSSGAPLTSTQLNNILKGRLEGYLDQNISAHSFRAGAASMLSQLGFSEKEVKAVGRWSSRAVESYVKLARTKRMEVAKKVRKFGLRSTV